MAGRLIVNADDFGLCEGVNKAVKQAHTDGVLTSATIMVGMGAAKAASRLCCATITPKQYCIVVQSTMKTQTLYEVIKGQKSCRTVLFVSRFLLGFGDQMKIFTEIHEIEHE